ncbi:MAG TPA: hypothetical protein VGG25_21395 [Streptosporangiaceae bacterium]|jgi:hypothetical protein
MELSAAQRKIAFVLVVLALAGLGVYLFTSAGRASGGQNGAAPPRHRASASSTPPPVSPSASATATSPAPSKTSPAEIYQWLPFTQPGLTSAAAVTVSFGDAYGTYSYTQSAKAYIATMHGLVTEQLAQQIEAAYSTSGVAALRASQHQVATGSAAISSIRAFGPTSITFIMTVNQRVTATRDGGQKSASYAVTVAGGASSWQVSGIELASQGNS